MLDLALHNTNGPVSLVDIAARQEISRKYLDTIIMTLKTAGLIRSVRGAGGGYALVKPAAEIDINTVVHLLEGSLSLVDCVEDPGLCHRAETCVTRDLWTEICQAIEEALSGITLQDLVERQQRKDPSGR